MHVGRRLKQLLQEKRISAETLARACGVTAGAVSNWFSTGHITRDNLVVCADVLRESLRYLITGDDSARGLGEIEAEWSRRDVSEGTRQAILTLVKASPLRPVVDQPPAAPPDPDAEHFRKAIEPHKPAPPPGSRKRGQ